MVAARLVWCERVPEAEDMVLPARACHLHQVLAGLMMWTASGTHADVSP